MNLPIESMPTLAAAAPPSGWVWALAIGFAVVCAIMMLVVLIQKPKGGGLSGAFGGGAGGGNTQAFIGGRVGDFLTWTTVICFLLFLGLAMGMTWMIHASDKPDEKEQQKQAQKEQGKEKDANKDAQTDTPEDSGKDTAK